MASEEEDTDTKLAILASLYPQVDSSTIFETLIEAEGSVEVASRSLQPLEACNDDVVTPTDPEAVSPPRAAKRQKTTSNQITGTSNNNSSSSSNSSVPLPSVPSQQLSIRRFHSGPRPLGPVARRAARKGQTLHLYDAEDVAAHTPCSIVHNFLPAAEAEALLRELLAESESFGRISFRMFERVVASPHSASFYVASAGEQRAQTREYVYSGAYLTDVRRITPQLAAVARPVEVAVNEEVAARVRDRYPHGRKLRFQSPERWRPNCAFVNCYDGAKESVGFHSDQLTYLGPRAVIGSLSLGVAREFRIKKIVPKDEPAEPDEIDVESAAKYNAPKDGSKAQPDRPPSARTSSMGSPLKRKLSDNSPDSHSITTTTTAAPSPGKPEPETPSSAAAPVPAPAPPSAMADDSSTGQIAIHLPHNSLLVMHAEMQEEWKHSIAAAGTVVPHPVAGQKRINVTYRWYRPEFHPRHTPRCRCGFPAVLRVVQRRAASHGRYMWMCHVSYAPTSNSSSSSGADSTVGGNGGGGGCSYFRWAEFDDDGRPEWAWSDKDGKSTGDAGRTDAGGDVGCDNGSADGINGGGNGGGDGHVNDTRKTET